MSLKKYLQKGEVIFHEGNPSDYAYIVQSGSIEIIERTSEGQKVLGVLGKNEIFGEMGLIDGLPRSATARAREDSLVYVLTPRTFESLVQANPEALLPIMKILTNRLRETIGFLKADDTFFGANKRHAVQHI